MPVKSDWRDLPWQLRSLTVTPSVGCAGHDNPAQADVGVVCASKLVTLWKSPLLAVEKVWEIVF